MEESHRGASPRRVDLKVALDIGKEEAQGVYVQDLIHNYN
jgi:hypothetical protein